MKSLERRQTRKKRTTSRSIGASGKLHEHFPERTDSILDILVHLDRLRRRVEQLYPQARNFKRPGFDEM